MESQRYTWGIGIGENGLRVEYYSVHYDEEKHKNSQPFVLHDEKITTQKTLVEELKKIVEGQFE